MTELNAFLRNSYTIKRGTEAHDLFVQYVSEVFEALNDNRTTILVTEGAETIKAMGLTDVTLSEPNGKLTQTVLMSKDFGAKIEIHEELLEDEAVDLTGYLCMAGGRAVGHYLNAASLDGEGRKLFVRFSNDYDITVSKYRPVYENAELAARLVGFDITLTGDVARESLVVSPA